MFPLQKTEKQQRGGGCGGGGRRKNENKQKKNPASADLCQNSSGLITNKNNK